MKAEGEEEEEQSLDKMAITRSSGNFSNGSNIVVSANLEETFNFFLKFMVFISFEMRKSLNIRLNFLVFYQWSKEA